ncbi:MAG: GAF domain-containing protein [Anaerolineae bacterium]|jgi:GAF domain-containing protein/HAMP domain-containing protein|nr:GAF domain-containing protein [Anaerolineae bacterium]
MVLIIVILPLLLLAPLLFLAGGEFRDQYREARLGKGHMITQQLRQHIDVVAPFVASVRDVPGLDRFLRDSISGQPELAFAALVRGDGIIVLHSTPGMVGQMLVALDTPDTQVQQMTVPQYGDVHLVFRRMTRRDISGQQLYGVVGAYSQIIDPPWLPWLAVAGTLILALILLVLLQVFMRRAVLKPLEELAEGAAIVGAGDLAFEIDSRRTDEIGFLARAFNDMGGRLRHLVTTLEQQVESRTAALARRNQQLEAVSLVAREAVTIQDLPTLLETTVGAISRQFGYYHAGIFWIDQSEQWAVLRAASSEGGRRMLERGHRLRVGQQGLVGSVAATAQPRIALDVGEDAVWFDNPDLPETRSEIALPLVDVGNHVVGVLDVQSTEVSAFSEPDIEILQLLADQVSVALRNAQLIEETRGTLAELEFVQQDYRRDGWARVMSRRQVQAYEYDGVLVEPVLPLPVPTSLTSGNSLQHNSSDSTTVMEPMQYRDQTIGMLTLSDPNRVWTEEELTLIRSVTDQVATALETARLFEETQRTARQQALLNAVLQTAAMTLDPDQALEEIAGILARGLAMAVGVFTFPRGMARSTSGITSASQEVRLQAFVLPGGEKLLDPGIIYTLPSDLQIFFHGLTEPELGKILPMGEVQTLTESYDLERVLYVPIRTATAQAGFLALIRQQEDVLLDPDTRTLARNLAGQVAVVLENLHLLEETQRRSAELQLLYEVSLRFGQVLEPEATERLVVDQAQELLVADGAAFLRYSESRADGSDAALQCVSALGPLESYRGASFNLGEGLPGTVLLERRVVQTEDYSTVVPQRVVPQRVVPNAWAQPQDLVPGSYAGGNHAAPALGPALGIPLTAARGVIGVLLVTRQRGALPFDAVVSRLAELFAAQATVALENARLYQESARRARDLQQLYEAGLSMIGMREVEAVLNTGAEWAMRLLGVQRTRVFFWERNNGLRSTPLPFSGFAAEDPRFAAPETLTLPRPGGVTDEVRAGGRPVIINRPAEGSRIAPALVDLGLVAQVAVPLRLGAEIVGVLFANSTTAGYFTEEIVRLLEFLGSQLATSAQNALQFDQLQQTLGVVELQSRYRDAVAQATAQLAERGTESMPAVLQLLGEVLETGEAQYCDLRSEGTGVYWEVGARWTPSAGATDGAAAGSAGSGSSKWRLDGFPEWLPALRTQGIVRVDASRASTVEQQALEALDFRSLLLIAVPSDASAPNFMAFGDSLREREWRPEELISVQTVAAALSSTLARERLFREVQTALAETEVLYEAGGALNAAQTYAQILDVMRQYTALGSGAHVAAILLYDRPWTERQRPTNAMLAARWAIAPDVDLSMLARGNTLAMLEPYLQRDRIHVITDVEREIDETAQATAPAYHFFQRSLQARTVVLTPLLVGGQAIGTFMAAFGTVTRLTEEEQRRLTTLTGQAAVAIQNIYQLEATAARARREQLIREIGDQIQAAPDVQSVLQTAARELGRALGTPRAVVRLGGVGTARRKKPTGELSPQAREESDDEAAAEAEE